MPKVGYSNPYVAEYVDDGVGGVTYKDGMRLGRGVSRKITPNNSSGDNKFRADNKDAESQKGKFKGATLEVSVAELLATAEAKILGAQTRTREINGKKIQTVDYNDEKDPPYLGFGDIVKLIVEGKTIWKGVILKKIKFEDPEDDAQTQEENINWQTQSISADVMRDDTPEHSWKESADFKTEAEADSFIRHMLNIKGNEVDPLTVISTEGETVGKTAIAVEEVQLDGRFYRYKTGKGVALPARYENLSSWTEWDGISEIEATTGDEIVIAEVDVVGLAIAAGKTTVTAKEE